MEPAVLAPRLLQTARRTPFLLQIGAGSWFGRNIDLLRGRAAAAAASPDVAGVCRLHIGAFSPTRGALEVRLDVPLLHQTHSERGSIALWGALAYARCIRAASRCVLATSKSFEPVVSRPRLRPLVSGHAQIGAILGSWGHSGPFWAILGHSGAILGFRGHPGLLGPLWAILGPSWGHSGSGAILGSWGRFG